MRRHAFFRAQYEALDEIIDEVAERVRDLNGISLGTHSEYLEHGRLKEFPGDYPEDIDNDFKSMWQIMNR